MLRVLVVVIALLAVLWPLRRLTSHRAERPSAPAQSVAVPESNVHLVLTSTSFPCTFSVSHLGQTIWKGEASESSVARDYGFTIEAIEGLSTESEASNRHVSELIDDIKKQGVKAIFLETTLNPKVTTQITRETGVKIGGTLYAAGLGPGEASTYEGMMKHNVSTIVDALK